MLRALFGVPLCWLQQLQVSIVVDTQERRYNGTHVYAPIGVTMSRWPGFPGNDPNVNTTEYALDSFKSMWLLANTYVRARMACASCLTLV